MPDRRSSGAARQRRSVHVTGVVQGVGFRPFVHRTATALGLSGWVGNDATGVVIDAEGDPAALDELCRRIRGQPPPLAHVDTVHVEVLPSGGMTGGFTIAPSTIDGHVEVPVGVDTAPCAACRAELLDPTDRRHRYPFLSCTDCGPRYTIVERLPYDRSRTTMAPFPLCGPCEVEFTDPADRRFHAQPTACPDCGPQLTWRAPDGTARAEHEPALVAAVATLRDGGLAAVKGVGGYHLLCRADDEVAVTRLRSVKAREGKPFAVLVADLAAAAALAELTDGDRTVLTGPQRAVTLVASRAGALPDGVAPGLAEVGLLLPPSPLHELLARDVAAPLVCTSGNLAGEPIAHRDEDAVARLGPFVDGLLTHDRAIHIRCDDSVVRGGIGGPLLLRRSRGYAPRPLPLPGPAGPSVLAVGGHLKATVAVAHGRHATVSHHVGDLDELAAREALRQAIDHLCHLTDTDPAVIAHDLHPEYASTAIAHELADRWQVPTVAVQHHHAHVASCLVEHRHEGPVLGVAFDGLGYGTDGTIWGGELLVADLATATRVGHLRVVPQPGGDAATREPWRMAVAWTRAALGDEAAVAEGMRHDPRAAQVAAVCASALTPVTSSVGRLFDAVAALLGLRARVTYEGEAAMLLEAVAGSQGIDPVPPVRPTTAGGTIDPSPLVCHLRAERDRGVAVDVLAARFHDGLAAAVVELAADLAEEHGVETVALTGGVFTNRRLTTAIESGLRARGRRVLRHGDVPCNDGGLSLGQLAVARARAREPAAER